MNPRPISQKSWFKGLNASVADASQPKGTLARISNLLYTLRGSLRVADGNLGFLNFNGAGPAVSRGNFMDIELFIQSNTNKYYMALAKGLDQPISIPTGLAAADGGAGGTLPINVTIRYLVTALDGAGNETPGSTVASFVEGGTAHKVNLTWTPATNAVSYNVYSDRGSGAVARLSGAGLPVTTTSYTDDGSAVSTTTLSIASITLQTNNVAYGGGTVSQALFVLTAAATTFIPVTGFTVTANSVAAFNTTWTLVQQINSTNYTAVASPALTTTPGTVGTGGSLTTSQTIAPIGNGTQQTVLFQMPVNNSSYSNSNIVARFPADPIVIEDSTGGGSGGSGGGGGGTGGTGGTTGAGASAGGVLGNVSPEPLLVPFVGKMILVLGNGFPPQQWNGTTVAALTNSYTASFPAWIASTALIAGSIIVPTAPNGHLYKAVQGGTTGTIQPTFPTASGATVADGTIIWQESGSTSTPAPRGAAHAIVHAGSLWLWNTQPTTTGDQLDGPSVLKMSDVNNPNSWNPVNTAFVNRDDGQQGMGMATFTIAESGIPPEGSLVLFKEFSTFQVIGVFGSTNFSIQRAQTDLGCIAPRTIQFVPGFGIVRLTHLGVAVFDGVRDRIISEEVRPYLFGGVSDISQMDQSFTFFSKADMVANPPMYCLAIPVIGQGNDGRLTRLLCYDLVLKAWSVVDLPSEGISVFKQIYSSGTIPLTIWGSMSNGMISRWQADDDQGFNAYVNASGTTILGSNIAFSFRSNSAIRPEPSSRLYFRRAIVKGTIGALAKLPASLSATTIIDRSINFGAAAPLVIVEQSLPATVDNDVEYVVEINQKGVDAYINFSGQVLPVAPGSLPHIFFESIDWHVQERPVGALVRIS